MTPGHPAAQNLERLAAAAMEAQVVRCFAVLDLANHLAHPSGAVRGWRLADLASVTECRADLLGRLLAAAAGLGLCVLDGDVVTLTSLGETLRSDVPHSMHARALLLTAPWLTRPWEGLADAMRSGRTPFIEHHRCDIWDYLDGHLDDNVTYGDAMADNAGDRADALVASMALPPGGTIVDVGGGTGRLLDRLLHKLPEARGVLADRATMLGAARARLAARSTLRRMTLTETNVLAAVPAGGDVYLLSRVLHNWSDLDAARILNACRRAMPAGARLFVLERLAPNGPASSETVETALTDLNMFVLYGGRERTAGEYEALLTGAGFGRVRIVLATAEFDVVETAAAR